MRAPWIALLTLALSAPALTRPALAQPAPHDPARLFPHEAAIQPSGEVGALHRLPLPAEVLSEARPDLSDVRIHDSRTEDVPFLVDSGARGWPRDASLPSYAALPIEAERRIEEGDSLLPIWRELLRVAVPGRAPEGTRWALEIRSSSGRFVRTVVVRSIEDDEATELARGSVYRFQDPLRERLSIALPPLPRVATLEVEVFGEGGYIEPELRFEASRERPDAPTLTLPLTELSRERRGGSTWIELARPVGLAPDRIRVRTSTGHFYREVRVLDVAQGEAARELGRDAIFRARELEGAEQLEIDVGAARGETLRIEIVDGDSPSLDEVGFEAVVRQPVLLFAAPAGGATLRFGGGRAHAPRYDLRRFLGTMVGERLGASRPLATLGPVRPNPRYDEAPALRFAMRAGRAAAIPRFTHLAPVTVRESPEGLSELRLTPEVLSAARFDLADVRVIDADGKQWPYLRADNETHELVGAEASAPEIEDQRSTYDIALPVERARIDRIVLHTEAPYLARGFVLRGIDDDGRRVELARGVLDRRPEESLPLEIDFGISRVSELELEVEDGSDAPIELTRVELGVVSPSLYLAAPEGEYRLLVGRADADVPEYEIERARSLVLSVRAGRAELGALSANPAHVEPPWHERAGFWTWVVWALLLLAVLVLGLLTLRLARTTPEPPSEGSKAEPKPSEDDPQDDDPNDDGSPPPVAF